MSQASLWVILEMYNIPDIGLLKSKTDVSQGSVLPPLLFSLFINALSRYLDDIGTSKRISNGLQGIPTL